MRTEQPRFGERFWVVISEILDFTLEPWYFMVIKLKSNLPSIMSPKRLSCFSLHTVDAIWGTKQHVLITCGLNKVPCMQTCMWKDSRSDVYSSGAVA